jgi:hypothetical protein
MPDIGTLKVDFGSNPMGEGWEEINKATLQRATQELVEASARYESAHRASELARTTETEALNALNRAQKEFDEAVAVIKNAAPRNSDWHSGNPRQRVFG